MNYAEYLKIDPHVRFARPCIAGTRITVYDILGWMASGMEIEEILLDYPELQDVHIRATLAFAADKEHKYKIAS